MSQRIDRRDPVGRIPSRGPCFLYVFPCAWEDILKLGFSRDPLGRLQALHPRYFEFFDLDRGLLLEAEKVRDARALELALARQVAPHNAPAPLVVRREAAGHTEWYRGAYEPLSEAIATLAARGHVLHSPLRPWLRHALQQRSDLLYSWTQAMLGIEELEIPACITPAQRVVRDVLDAQTALGIDIEPLLPAAVLQWHRTQASSPSLTIR